MCICFPYDGGNVSRDSETLQLSHLAPSASIISLTFMIFYRKKSLLNSTTVILILISSPYSNFNFKYCLTAIRWIFGLTTGVIVFWKADQKRCCNHVHHSSETCVKVSSSMIFSRTLPKIDYFSICSRTLFSIRFIALQLELFFKDPTFCFVVW